MALEFIGSAGAVYYNAPIVTGPPFTVSCWASADEDSELDGLFCITDFNAVNFQSLSLYSTAGVPAVVCSTYETNFADAVAASPSGGLGDYIHCMGIWAANNDRTAVADGNWAGRGTNTVTKNVSGQDLWGIGNIFYGSAKHFVHDGRLAEIGVWNVALGEVENAMLAAGVSPLLVRPDALVWYWPGHNIQRDLVALVGLPAIQYTGTELTTAEHPRIIAPSAQIFIFPSRITGTGALSAQASTVAGTGAVSGAVTGTGALSSQASAVAGTGEIEKTGTGALASGASTVAGTGEVTKTGTGALSSQASAVAGVGTVGNAVAGTGALSAQAAAVAGSGVVGRVGTGALSSQDSAIAGTGLRQVTGTGALSAAAGTVAGTGLREITGTGALAAQAASIAGAEVVVTYDEIELAVTITREQALEMTVTREVST